MLKCFYPLSSDARSIGRANFHQATVESTGLGEKVVDRRSFLHASLCVVATGSGRIFEPGSQSDAFNSAIREDPQLPTDPAFVKAMQAVQHAIPGAEADPDRPVYHFRP